jgi:hypothetical protein
MTTALDLIQDSLEQLQVYAPGQPITAADGARGLSVLNSMLDSWSNENLSCYAILEQSAPLVPGKSTYTIGAGGDINVTRPIKIIDGQSAAYLQDNLGNNFPVDVVAQDVWNDYGNRTVTSTIPTAIFYDPQFPLGKINVFPVPTLAYTLFWDSYLQLTQFSSLSAQLTFPPGYQEAIRNNLSVRLKPYYKAGPIDQIIVALASESKANIKRTNLRPVTAAYDPELIAKGSGTYNIYRDNAG